jgi:hypothetical protein
MVPVYLDLKPFTGAVQVDHYAVNNGAESLQQPASRDETARLWDAGTAKEIARP